MIQKTKKKKSINNSSLIISTSIIKIIIVFLLILLYFWALNPVPQLLSTVKELKKARQTEAKLSTENKRLKEEKSKLFTDKKIEEIARQEYGFIKPGEKAYVVLTPKDKPEQTEFDSKKKNKSNIVKEQSFIDKILGW